MSFLSLFGRKQPKFRFTLITDYVNLQELPHAPKGWDKPIFNFARSDGYFGMMRSFTAPLSYVLDGAWVLRKEYYGYPGRNGHGMEGNCPLRVDKFNPSTMQWDFVYQGDNDFSQFKDHGSLDGDIVTINVMEGGITRMVKAYESVKYTIPIPITGPDTKIINLTPIKLQETAQFIFTPVSGGFEDGYPGLQIVTNEQKALTASAKDVATHGAPPVNFSTEPIEWAFFEANVDTLVRITNGNIQGSSIYFAGAYNPQHIRISIYRSDNTEVFNIYDFSNDGHQQDFNINFTATIPVLAGQRLFLFTRFFDHGSVVINSGEMNLKYDVISAATDCKAVTAKYLFKQLMQKMNNDVPVPCQSYLLDTAPWNTLLLTSGNAIKPYSPQPIYSTDSSLVSGTQYYVYIGSIVYNGTTHTVGNYFYANNNPSFTSTNPDAYVLQLNSTPAIIISWKDFFQSMNSMLGTGWGVEGTNSVLEKKNYFFRANMPIANLGACSKFELSAFQRYTYNSIKCGYEDQIYDQVNGASEFNSQVNWSTPLTRIKKELDLISPIRADSTGVELLRVGLNNVAKGQSNTSANNDTFAIYCQQTLVDGKYIPEPASVFTSLSGLDTNLYNLRISPCENLSRHSDYLAGMLDGVKGGNIKFESGEKNVNLSRIGSNGQVIKENANISISSLGTPLFLPHEVDITIKEPFDMLNLLSNSTNGCITVNSDGVDFTGFILDCNTDLNMNTPQDIKLLATPNNNMMNFVR